MVTASDETSVADWLVNSLISFTTYTAESVVPAVYEAYARNPVSCTKYFWICDVGADHNVVWTSLTPCYEIWDDFDSNTGRKPLSRTVGWSMPYHMPNRQAKTLVSILGSFTATTDKMWYLVWDGHGDIPRTSLPRVQRPHRNYLLYSGGIDDVGDRGIPEHHVQPPE